MNTLPRNNTPSDNAATDQEWQELQVERGKLPNFLLSAVPPCEVELVSDETQQTRPSKTWSELLADGQCEV